MAKTIEEALKEKAEQLEALYSSHSLGDFEYLEINEETREIFIPEMEKLLGVESDERTERKYFQCPRYVGDNIDLSELSLRINYRNANNETDVYIVDDVEITEEGSPLTGSTENITFSWLLSRKVTRYKGAVQFIVCAVRSEGETIKNEWNTTLATGTVLEGLETEVDITTEEKDVLQQLINMSTESANIAKKASEDATAATAEANKAVQQAQSLKDQLQGLIDEAQGIVDRLGDAIGLTTQIPFEQPTGEIENIVSGETVPEIFGKVQKVFDSLGEAAQYDVANTIEEITEQTPQLPDANLVKNISGSYVTYGAEEAREQKTEKIRDIVTGLDNRTTRTEEEGKQNSEKIVNLENKTEAIDLTERKEASGKTILLEDSQKDRLQGLKLFGWSKQEGTPTPENPIPILSAGSETGSIVTSIYGGNLAPYQTFTEDKNSTKGLDITYSNGYFDISGEISVQDVSRSYIALNIDHLDPGTYYVDVDVDVDVDYVYKDPDGKNHYVTTNIINVDETQSIKRIRILLRNANVEVGTKYDLSGTIMLSTEQGEPFESVKESQALEYSTPNGLPGIPVDSGGNYTDETGQQWICDEVDFEHGVYIENIENIENISDVGVAFYDNTNTNRFSIHGKSIKGDPSSVLCNFSKNASGGSDKNTIRIFGNDIFVFLDADEYQNKESFLTFFNTGNNVIKCIRQNSLEIPLVQPEIEEYKALYTNKSKTTITNNSNVHVEIGYTADPNVEQNEDILEMQGMLEAHRISIEDLTDRVASLVLNKIDTSKILTSALAADYPDNSYLMAGKIASQQLSDKGLSFIGNPSSPGWYRIAKYQTQSTDVNNFGDAGESGIIMLSKQYQHSRDEGAILSFCCSCGKEVRWNCLNAFFHTQSMQKIRFSLSLGKSLNLEMYYSGTTLNSVKTKLTGTISSNFIDCNMEPVIDNPEIISEYTIPSVSDLFAIEKKLESNRTMDV